jgi:hypothetical protein
MQYLKACIAAEDIFIREDIFIKDVLLNHQLQLEITQQMLLPN